MSDRGTESFSWSADEGRSARVVAAIALLVAGWVFGFFAGRVSAWVLPVANPDLVAIKAAMKPAQQPAVPPQVTNPPTKENTERPNLALSPGTTPPEQSSMERPDPRAQAPVNTPPMEFAEPGAIAKPVPRGAVVVNPDWSTPPVAESMPPRAERNSASEPDMAECERRYSSFRASDGTYQPYGRSTRVRCPLLR